MNSLSEQDQLFIQSFIAPERRARWSTLLSSKSGRKKFRNRLAHSFYLDLDPRYTYQEDALPEEIDQKIQYLLKESGWKTSSKCYVMAEWKEWDGCEMTLEEAREKHDDWHGMIVIVIPGRLAYYWTESPDPSYVLFRSSASE